MKIQLVNNKAPANNKLLIYITFIILSGFLKSHLKYATPYF